MTRIMRAWIQIGTRTIRQTFNLVATNSFRIPLSNLKHQLELSTSHLDHSVQYHRKPMEPRRRSRTVGISSSSNCKA